MANNLAIAKLADTINQAYTSSVAIDIQDEATREKEIAAARAVQPNADNIVAELQDSGATRAAIESAKATRTEIESSKWVLTAQDLANQMAEKSPEEYEGALYNQLSTMSVPKEIRNSVTVAATQAMPKLRAAHLQKRNSATRAAIESAKKTRIKVESGKWVVAAQDLANQMAEKSPEEYEGALYDQLRNMNVPKEIRDSVMETAKQAMPKLKAAHLQKWDNAVTQKDLSAYANSISVIRDIVSNNIRDEVITEDQASAQVTAVLNTELSSRVSPSQKAGAVTQAITAGLSAMDPIIYELGNVDGIQFTPEQRAQITRAKATYDRAKAQLDKNKQLADDMSKYGVVKDKVDTARAYDAKLQKATTYAYNTTFELTQDPVKAQEAAEREELRILADPSNHVLSPVHQANYQGTIQGVRAYEGDGDIPSGMLNSLASQYKLYTTSLGRYVSYLGDDYAYASKFMGALKTSGGTVSQDAIRNAVRQTNLWEREQDAKASALKGFGASKLDDTPVTIEAVNDMYETNPWFADNERLSNTGATYLTSIAAAKYQNARGSLTAEESIQAAIDEAEDRVVEFDDHTIILEENLGVKLGILDMNDSRIALTTLARSTHPNHDDVFTDYDPVTKDWFFIPMTDGAQDFSNVIIMDSNMVRERAQQIHRRGN